MHNFLKEIIKSKKKRLEIAKAETPLAEMKQKAFAVREKRESNRLRTVLEQNDKINIIAEYKRASPSKGIINDEINAAETARKYERGGACAVSVLTEEDFFKGSLDDLRTAREKISIPILRKDFIFDEFQIYEAAANGADAILLIAAMLEDKDLLNLYLQAEELGLDVLLEVHTREELERVESLGAKIIGVNNRDLQTFKVSLDVSRELIKSAPKDALLIAESGLSRKEEIEELYNLGFAGFLIGETLMRSGNIEEELRSLATNYTN